MQEYCSRVAQHALVLGPSGHVQPNPTEPAQSDNSALQSDSSQEPWKPKSACLAPRASTVKEQGFPTLLQFSNLKSILDSVLRMTHL